MEEKKELAEGFIGLVKAAQYKFLPDVIEARLTRVENEGELCYKEYFTYLPEEVLDIMMPITMKFMELFFKRMEISIKMTRIKQGVQADIKGPPDVIVSMPLVETLIFGTTKIEEARNLTKAMLIGAEAISSGKVIRKWDENLESEFEQVKGHLEVAMRLLGVSTIEELMSQLSEEMFDAILKQLR